MNGSLTAYSDGPGKGASFVLRIPVEYADQLPQSAGYSEAGSRVMSDSGSVRRLIDPNRRILIVDDNRAIHEDFHKILGGAGAGRGDLERAARGAVRRGRGAGRRGAFELDSAYQGEEAIEKVRSRARARPALRARVRRRADAAGPRRHPDDRAAARAGSGSRHRHLLGVLGPQLGGDDAGFRQDGPRADPEEAVRHRRGSPARACAAAALGACAARRRCASTISPP